MMTVIIPANSKSIHSNNTHTLSLSLSLSLFYIASPPLFSRIHIHDQRRRLHFGPKQRLDARVRLALVIVVVHIGL
jgi:hypothetical protein